MPVLPLRFNDDELLPLNSLAQRCAIPVDEAVRRTALYTAYLARHPARSDHDRLITEATLLALVDLPAGGAAARPGRARGELRVELTTPELDLLDTLAGHRDVPVEELLSDIASDMSARLPWLRMSRRPASSLPAEPPSRLQRDA